MTDGTASLDLIFMGVGGWCHSKDSSLVGVVQDSRSINGGCRVSRGGRDDPLSEVNTLLNSLLCRLSTLSCLLHSLLCLLLNSLLSLLLLLPLLSKLFFFLGSKESYMCSSG